MKHSPLPWRENDGTVFGPDPHDVEGEVMICETAPDGAALTEYDQANAQFIVQAANHHDELVAIVALLNGWPPMHRQDGMLPLFAAAEKVLAKLVTTK